MVKQSGFLRWLNYMSNGVGLRPDSTTNIPLSYNNFYPLAVDFWARFYIFVFR